MIRSDPGTIRADTAAALPVRRWQRVQWQYAADTSGSVISKRTPPQRQPPVRDSSCMPEAYVSRTRAVAER